MPRERVQRRIDRLLDEAEQALDKHDWRVAADRARDVLLLDADNEDAQGFLTAAERALRAAAANSQHPSDVPLAGAGESPALRADATPTSFDAGRYTVKRLLGEGGKKKVYLAHDKMLDRDVAFALIKTAGLDDVGREHVSREAQAMGRLGSHPHIVTVFDLGKDVLKA